MRVVYDSKMLRGDPHAGCRSGYAGDGEIAARVASETKPDPSFVPLRSLTRR
jgi:hypothetical protein